MGAGASLNSVSSYPEELSFRSSGLCLGFLERGGRSRGSSGRVKFIEVGGAGAGVFNILQLLGEIFNLRLQFLNKNLLIKKFPDEPVLNACKFPKPPVCLSRIVFFGSL